jgi:hypothetical protein
MADAELVRTLDYILNRCDEGAVEAVAAAVVRRKRDLALFGASNIPDPRRFAKEAAGRLAGGAPLDAIRSTVRDMAAGMLRKEAPELEEGQIDELLAAWLPGGKEGGRRGDGGNGLPSDVLVGMVDQFLAFSAGTMPDSEDAALRADLGAWPERYWQAFPQALRSVVTDRLAGRSGEAEFRRALAAVLELEYDA